LGFEMRYYEPNLSGWKYQAVLKAYSEINLLFLNYF